MICIILTLGTFIRIPTFSNHGTRIYFLRSRDYLNKTGEQQRIETEG